MPSCLEGCLPRAGSGNYLYILLMEEADSDIKKFPFSKQPPQGPHHGVGILTCRPLPHNQVVYIHIVGLHVTALKTDIVNVHFVLSAGLLQQLVYMYIHAHSAHSA